MHQIQTLVHTTKEQLRHINMCLWSTTPVHWVSIGEQPANNVENKPGDCHSNKALLYKHLQRRS
jgi:hypothetical protein